MLEDTVIEVRIGAAVVLGKLGDTRAVAYLERMAGDPFSEVREAAEAAIVQIQKRRN
jgi:HEAT repeat protein